MKYRWLPFRVSFLNLSFFIIGFTLSLSGFLNFSFVQFSMEVERFTNPHMYYVRSFVESLPLHVQEKMRVDAKAMGLDIYEYNLQMCSASDEDFSWWSI